ncbi:MAG: hypothetical protein HY758_07460 [Nitrospirae bacterium]|nr:hypothetical protein [Nitrospirota bacterium]
MAGMNQIMIIRRDTGVTWMLMPEQKMYMETRIGGPKRREIADLDDYQVEHTVVGDEVVNGINTTKNKVIVTGPQGNKLGGFMWVSWRIRYKENDERTALSNRFSTGHFILTKTFSHR